MCEHTILNPFGLLHACTRKAIIDESFLITYPLYSPSWLPNASSLFQKPYSHSSFWTKPASSNIFFNVFTVAAIEIILMHFVLPALITFAVSEWMRKMKWIKDGDMLLRL